MEGKSRPILIAIIGFFTILAAVLILVMSALALFADTIFADLGVDLAEYIGSVEFIGYGGIIGALILLIIGISIWRGWSIAWYIAVLLYGIGLILMLYSMYLVITADGLDAVFVLPFAISLLVIVLILYYLFRPKVKEFFGI
ncbi:MAG: hypothetical protein FWH45_01600 [Methanomassiliicoccaceae archaeon]|nr:hypothetical protein [Methanomassiliicoccaceae archaeon]MCL2145859.1 hypothetical protein [Methanomassiliicoccaceae archaeon]